MGIYIDPVKISKEDWLIESGAVEIKNPKWETKSKGKVYLAHVDNTFFTALGIAIDKNELARFSGVNDRPVKFYEVDKEKLFDKNLGIPTSFLNRL